MAITIARKEVVKNTKNDENPRTIAKARENNENQNLAYVLYI